MPLQYPPLASLRAPVRCSPVPDTTTIHLRARLPDAARRRTAPAGARGRGAFPPRPDLRPRSPGLSQSAGESAAWRTDAGGVSPSAGGRGRVEIWKPPSVHDHAACDLALLHDLHGRVDLIER